MPDAPVNFATVQKPDSPGSTREEPEPDAISRTSVWAVAARAIAARIPDARVRDPDWLAEKFLTSEELALLGETSAGGGA